MPSIPRDSERITTRLGLPKSTGSQERSDENRTAQRINEDCIWDTQRTFEHRENRENDMGRGRNA